jgi:PleD family two-component response regulator
VGAGRGVEHGGAAGGEREIVDWGGNGIRPGDMSPTRKSSPGRRRKRIVLVDDNAWMRRAVAEWISRTMDLEVCGEAATSAHALKVCEQTRPGLVLTEIMEQYDFKFIRELHRRWRRLPILVFSFRDELWYGPRALEAGARGYLTKGVEGGRLLRGIREALKGRLVLDAALRSQLGWDRAGMRAARRHRPRGMENGSGSESGARPARHRTMMN